MTGQSTERQPSDKGQWYLEMLGMDSDDGPPTLQQIAESRQTTSTSETVTEMWDQTSEMSPMEAPEDALTGWSPTELSTTVSSRRKVRWPILIGAIVVGIAAALALWWMPQESERRTSNHADSMRAALAAVHDDLADTQTALAIATEPTSAEPDLSLVAVNLAGIADSSAQLLDVANQPVPANLPLTARETFDDLDSFRQTLEPPAAEATAIRIAVADIADYRLAFARVLNVSELPVVADTTTITEQGAALARVLANSVAALAEMPLDGPFAAHRALVDSEVTAFTDWQDDYLAALRKGDTTEAHRLVDELNDSRRSLEVEVVGTLATLRSEVDGRILDLADRLDRAIQLVP